MADGTYVAGGRLLRRTLEEALGSVEGIVQAGEAGGFGLGPAGELLGRLRGVLDSLAVRDVELRIGRARDRMVKASVELVTLAEVARAEIRKGAGR